MKRFWLFLIVLLLIGGVLAAQDIPPDLVDFIEGLEDYTTEVRGLPELESVTRLFPSRQEAIDYVTELYRQEIPPDEAERLAQFYIALDLLPAGTDYLSIFLDLMSAQIGGFYNPDTKEMNILLLNNDELGDDLPLMEQIIYVHEFTHALQDQHFGIAAVQEAAAENVDESLAILALIEGDATQVMNLYTAYVSQADPLGTALQLLAQGAATNTLTVPPGTPEIVATELLWTYLAGADFVAALYRQGGWEAVNAAYANPPQSTEQILHPQAYIDGEAPLVVDLPDADLGDDWTQTWDTTLGEFYLREYLKTQISDDDAAEAAAGWGGDNLHIYHNTASGELAWLLRVEWDDATEAAEFADFFNQYAEAKFDAAADENGCWDGLCLVSGDTDHLIAGGPDAMTARLLLDSVTVR